MEDEPSNGLLGQNELSDCAEMQRQLADLNHMNQRLIEDNLTLRLQYEQALGLAQQMENVHNENTRLTGLVHSHRPIVTNSRTDSRSA
jgi:hypothetical protein